MPRLPTCSDIRQRVRFPLTGRTTASFGRWSREETCCTPSTPLISLTNSTTPSRLQADETALDGWYVGPRRPSSMAKSMSRAPPSLPYSGSCPSHYWLRVSASVRCSLKRRNIQADPARVLDQNTFHHRFFPLMA